MYLFERILGRSTLALVLLVAASCSSERVRGSGKSDAGVGTDLTVGIDPTGCERAAEVKSYVGCDYWPTVVANSVWSIFDFAVVVANAGDVIAEVTVDGPAGFHSTNLVQPNELTKIYLPWVPELKGKESDVCGSVVPNTASVLSAGGAYHLVSSRPVSVYQFSALEFKGAGGPPGKNWSSCPGDTTCPMTGAPLGCFSYSNDASLLLPSTAMTGTYRITGYPKGSYFAVTATQAETEVTVKLSSTAASIAGGGLSAQGPGSTFTFNLDVGDVAQVLSNPGLVTDFSGSLVAANKPVQVITGNSCAKVPAGLGSCDHIEESTWPAETLGKDYVVTRPSGPRGIPVGHLVRIYGNFDNTKLTFNPTIPGAVTSINAGQVIDLGVVNVDFEVIGDQSFAVSTFQQGGSEVDPLMSVTSQQGDPSQSHAVSVEQFRLKYIFLAPGDYDSNFADVTLPMGTVLHLDGGLVIETPSPVGSSQFGVTRLKLGNLGTGAHSLTASQPVGIQVMGYGRATSYQYPGGLNLAPIAPVPVL